MQNKCKTPKSKPAAKSLWLYNGLTHSVEIRVWPHITVHTNLN